jgi:hypothetical protein
MIRKLKSGEYRLYSRKKDPKTGKRRNLGTFKSRREAEAHERAVQYFKRPLALPQVEINEDRNLALKHCGWRITAPLNICGAWLRAALRRHHTISGISGTVRGDPQCNFGGQIG